MMAHVDHVDCVDRSLRDIRKVDKPFGGIAVVFSGDPRQILPVVHHGNRAQIVEVCVQSSLLWKKVKQLKLTSNMRVAEEEINFSSYVLTIGDGKAQLCNEMLQVLLLF